MYEKNEREENDDCLRGLKKRHEKKEAGEI